MYFCVLVFCRAVCESVSASRNANTAVLFREGIPKAPDPVRDQ